MKMTRADAGFFPVRMSAVVDSLARTPEAPVLSAGQTRRIGQRASRFEPIDRCFVPVSRKML
jgi:hypothetical protein